MSRETTARDPTSIERALDTVATLAAEVGPRRPTSRGERVAAEAVAESIRSAGLDAEVEHFAGYSSFGYPYGAIAALATAPAMLPRRWRTARGAVAALAAGLLATEGGLVRTPLSDLLATRRSQNVVATLEPRGTALRTLCLIAHVDSSRSGLLFDPRFASQLHRWIALQSIATLALPAEPVLARTAPGRAVIGIARAIAAAGLAVLAEREVRGVDVPGANDNASGVGVVVQLAAEAAGKPPESTRLVVLVPGCEEAGLLGARAFLDARDTSDWLFLNFDSVGSAATLRYTPAEGVMRTWACDPLLIALAERVAAERPDLGLAAAEEPIGLTYDATAVLARGGRALTFVAGDGGLIPNYHQPTDTLANLDRATIARAVAVGREMIAAIDRGEADPTAPRPAPPGVG